VRPADAVGHGVSRSQARKLISEYDDSQIENSTGSLGILARTGRGVRANKPWRWLVKAIVENYSMPRGFKSSTQLAEENRQKAEKAKERQEAARRKKAEEQAEQARANERWEKEQRRIREYLESLGSEERLKVVLRPQ
jgi:primosomal protein N'